MHPGGVGIGREAKDDITAIRDKGSSIGRGERGRVWSGHGCQGVGGPRRCAIGHQAIMMSNEGRATVARDFELERTVDILGVVVEGLPVIGARR